MGDWSFSHVSEFSLGLTQEVHKKILSQSRYVMIIRSLKQDNIPAAVVSINLLKLKDATILEC